MSKIWYNIIVIFKKERKINMAKAKFDRSKPHVNIGTCLLYTSPSPRD